MTTLRFLFILLLLLNALAFAAIKGWLGFVPPRGEPERITNQLHPERIILPADNAPKPELPSIAAPSTPEPAAVSPAPAPTAAQTTAAASEQAPEIDSPRPDETSSAEQQCLVWAGLGTSEADRLDALLTAAGIAPRHSSIEVPSSWWVRIPPLGSKEAAERRVADLRAQGVSELFIVQDAGPNQFAISLGLFKTEVSAKQQLSRLGARGVRDAAIVVRTTSEHRIEVSAPRTVLQAAITRNDFGRQPANCAP